MPLAPCLGQDSAEVEITYYLQGWHRSGERTPPHPTVSFNFVDGLTALRASPWGRADVPGMASLPKQYVPAAEFVTVRLGVLLVGMSPCGKGIWEQGECRRMSDAEASVYVGLAPRHPLFFRASFGPRTTMFIGRIVGSGAPPDSTDSEAKRDGAVTKKAVQVGE